MLIRRVVVGETNCYWLRDSGGAVLVDAGPAGAAGPIVVEATAAGIRPEDVRLIFISHGHLDHYGAVAELRAWCGAPVAAYHTEPVFSQNKRNALPPAQTLRGSLIRWLYLFLSPSFRFSPLQADVFLDDGDDLSAFGVDARVVLVPGHSPGSLALITAEGDAFVGDLFVNYTVPSQPIYLADLSAWGQSYARIQAFEPRMVYVGHGEPFAGAKLDRIYPARYQLRWWVR